MSTDIQHVADVILTNTVFYNKSTINTVDCANRTWYQNSAVNAFYNCQNLTQVTNLHNNITDLTNCFYNCQNLRQFPNLPKNGTNFANCFYNCQNIYDNVTSIPQNAINISNMFSHCRNLKIKIPTIPSSVNSMDYAFYFTDVITTPNIETNTITSLNGTFYCCQNLITPPKIPNSVTSMKESFRYCSNLANIPAIPNTVTNLFMAFDNCISLTDISNSDIPRSVTDMAHTFENCASLTNNIYILSRKITRASDIFRNTSLPKNVYIPFKNENNTYSATYNAFISAGYSSTTEKDGVTLVDGSNLCIFDLTVKQEDALITVTYEDTTIKSTGLQHLVLPKNTVISYSIHLTRYRVIENTITITEDVYLDIDLEEPSKQWTVEYNPQEYTDVTTEQGFPLKIGSGTTKTDVNLVNDFIVTEITE